MDSFSCAVSIALQHGVPLKLLCEKFAHTRFEPSGWSGNPDIGFAKSIMDYIFRWLQLRFLPDSSNCCSTICGQSPGPRRANMIRVKALCLRFRLWMPARNK